MIKERSDNGKRKEDKVNSNKKNRIHLLSPLGTAITRRQTTPQNVINEQYIIRRPNLNHTIKKAITLLDKTIRSLFRRRHLYSIFKLHLKYKLALAGSYVKPNWALDMVACVVHFLNRKREFYPEGLPYNSDRGARRKWSKNHHKRYQNLVWWAWLKWIFIPERNQT